MLRVEQADDTWIVYDDKRGGAQVFDGPEWECWLYVAEHGKEERRKQWSES